jgi:hypothetical protein
LTTSCQALFLRIMPDSSILFIQAPTSAQSAASYQIFSLFTP